MYLRLYDTTGANLPVDPPNIQVQPQLRCGGEGLNLASINQVLATFSPSEWWADDAFCLLLGAFPCDGKSQRRGELSIGYSHSAQLGWHYPNYQAMRWFWHAGALCGCNARWALTEQSPGAGHADELSWTGCTRIQNARVWPGTRTGIGGVVPLVFTSPLSTLYHFIGFQASSVGGAVPDRTPVPLFTQWALSAAATQRQKRAILFGALFSDGSGLRNSQAFFRKQFLANPLPGAAQAAPPGPPSDDLHYIEFFQKTSSLSVVHFAHQLAQQLGLRVSNVYQCQVGRWQDDQQAGWRAVMSSSSLTTRRAPAASCFRTCCGGEGGRKPNAVTTCTTRHAKTFSCCEFFCEERLDSPALAAQACVCRAHHTRVSQATPEWPLCSRVRLGQESHARGSCRVCVCGSGVCALRARRAAVVGSDAGRRL